GAELDSSLLDLLTAHTLKDSESENVDNVNFITAEEVHGLTRDIVMGGTDVMPSATSFLLYSIVKNSKVLAKIHKEIDEVFGPNSTIELTFEKLENCHYIEAVVKETLRHATLLPMSVIISDEEENIAGYNWPSGTKIWLDHQTLNNNSEYWDDPETFNPDRFLSKDKISELQKIAYNPFGCGTRTCVGRLMALNMMKSIVVLFFSKYNMELVKSNEKIKYHY
ncbi:20730_t:CDS:2, partial [Cetraspora pellucida]